MPGHWWSFDQQDHRSQPHGASPGARGPSRNPHRVTACPAKPSAVRRTAAPHPYAAFPDFLSGGRVGEGVNPVYMWITSHARAPVRPRMPSHPMPVACRSCSLRHLLPRPPPRHGRLPQACDRRAPVRSLLVVEPDPLCDHAAPRSHPPDRAGIASYFRESVTAVDKKGPGNEWLASTLDGPRSAYRRASMSTFQASPLGFSPTRPASARSAK